VSASTRGKVIKAAKKLGYQPNVIARSLITRSSRLIGLIMGEWENPFYTTLLRRFTEKLHVRNYRLMLLGCNSDQDVDAATRVLMQYRVDGIVLVSTAPGDAAAREFTRSGGRIVLINNETGQLPATSILCDNAKVGRGLAQSLLAAGYAKFALLRGDPTLRTSQLRNDGFRKELRSAGMGTVVLERSNLVGYAAGRAFVREAMSLESPPDAILCPTDATAIGVIDGARLDKGIDIPDTLGVVGFGDIPAASWGSHDLTTVRLPIERMVDVAVETLFADADSRAVRTVSIDAEIVARASTRLLRIDGRD
jgi:DNA-binding LacI/PurR family transcriptional regulator